MRRDLKLRFITVERNGFGQTEFDDSLTMTDYVSDVETVLSHLQIDRFALFGFPVAALYSKNCRAPCRAHPVCAHGGHQPGDRQSAALQ